MQFLRLKVRPKKKEVSTTQMEHGNYTLPDTIPLPPTLSYLLSETENLVISDKN